MELIDQIKQLREIGAASVKCQDGQISEVVFERLQKNAKLAEIEKLANLSEDDLLFASSPR